MNTNYSKQQMSRPQTHGNYYSTYNKAKGKRLTTFQVARIKELEPIHQPEQDQAPAPSEESDTDTDGDNGDSGQMSLGF